MQLNLSTMLRNIGFRCADQQLTDPIPASMHIVVSLNRSTPYEAM